MKRLIFFIAILTVVILSVGSVVACSDQITGDKLRSGVFLPVGDTLSKSGEIPSDWVAVIDNRLSFCDDGKIIAYDLKEDKGIYTASSSDGNASVSLSGDYLTFEKDGQKTEYCLSHDYEYIETIQESRIPVLTADTIEENGKKSVRLKGGYADRVLNGLQVDIKTSDGKDYKSYAIAENQADIYTAVIPSDEFTAGDNFVRVRNTAEYPMINGDKKLFLKTASESIEYKITVDPDGNITFVQNDDTLGNGVYKFAYSSITNTQEEKDYRYFVVIDGMLTESFKGGKELYYLRESDGVYSMNLRTPDVNGGKTFTVKNGIITVSVENSGEVYQLKKDDSYTYSEESEKLEKPLNPGYGVSDIASRQEVWFRFFALDTSYPIGVKVEIKKAGSENYEFYDIDVPYRAEIYVDGIGADKLSEGYNFVRICNAGAPVATDSKRYFMKQDSDYIEFIVLLDETGIQVGPYFEEK